MRTVPLAYNVRSLLARRTSTALALAAIALSVAVLVVVLSLAKGFELSLAGTGRADNAILLRKGAQSEGLSVVDRGLARTLLALPHFARGRDGAPLAEAELYAGFAIEKAGGGSTNVPIRGVGARALRIRDTVELAAGRMFAPGTTELVVGRNLIERIRGCRLGGVIRLAGRDWPVVGVLDAGGSAYDSEIWGDVEVLIEVFDRGAYNLVIGRLAPDAAMSSLASDVAADPRLRVQATPERRYFARQSDTLATVLRTVAWFLAAILGIGSVFGAANTLFASVAARTREIGTLLAIGFRPAAVFAGFLIESLLLGLAGGALGTLPAPLVHGIRTGTTNWQTFTEQAFTFRVTPDVITSALILSAVIGLLGGALPALRASRLRPVDALQSL